MKKNIEKNLDENKVIDIFIGPLTFVKTSVGLTIQTREANQCITDETFLQDFLVINY